MNLRAKDSKKSSCIRTLPIWMLLLNIMRSKSMLRSTKGFSKREVKILKIDNGLWRESKKKKSGMIKEGLKRWRYLIRRRWSDSRKRFKIIMKERRPWSIINMRMGQWIPISGSNGPKWIGGKSIIRKSRSKLFLKWRLRRNLRKSSWSSKQFARRRGPKVSSY